MLNLSVSKLLTVCSGRTSKLKPTRYFRPTKSTMMARMGLVCLMALLATFGLAALIPGIGPAQTVQALPAAGEGCSVSTTPSILGGQVSLSNVSINGGNNCASVEPGATLNISFNYTIKDVGCPGCIDQIQIGYSNKPTIEKCAYSGLPGPEGQSGRATLSLAAPSASGTYYLAFDRSEDYGCKFTKPNWWTKPTTGDQAYYFGQVTVNPSNTSWATASDLVFTPDNGKLHAQAQQFLTDPDGSRWYRFKADANSKVFVLLNGVSPATTLPFQMNLSLYSDIQKEYNRLTKVGANNVLLTAQVAPSEYLPSEYLPSEYLPSEYLPSEYLPSEYLPSEYLPSEYLSADFINNQVATEASRPASYQAEAYSGALKNSLVAVAASQSTAPEYISRNTRNTAGYYYVRVQSQGGSSTTVPFHLDVILDGGSCGNVSAVAGTPSYPNAAGQFNTLVVTDYSKLPGTSADKTALKQKLDQFRALPEVKGTVLDLAATNGSGQPLYPRINQAAQIAQNNLQCPLAKNLLATEIKSLLDSYAPNYIVLIGADDVIPFFRYPDQAGLGEENEYIPPVNGAGGQANALFQNMVLGQDYYGSRFQYTRSDLNLAVPNAPVGRLVQTAGDVLTMLNAYLATGGVVTPKSALVTGYSFVTSVGQAVKDEFSSSINAPNCGSNCLPVNSLISETWSADDLRAKFINKPNDLVFLGAHFSAGNAEAADRSRVLASEFASSATPYTNSVIFSVGCHSGYNISASDTLAGYSPDPDWPRAFAQKGATAIVGTGYQYGDTQLIEYSARLYDEFTIQLHTRATPYSGSGPLTTSVPIGQALVRAKQRYLADTTPLQGMHAKVLTEATLYGLPMLKVTLNGRDPVSDSPDVSAPTSFNQGPGLTYNLKSADYPVNSISLRNNSVSLTDPNGHSQTATYLSGRDGVVSNPLEPIFPLELHNVTISNNVLRGVGFLRGTYQDKSNVFPLVAQPEFDQGRARVTAGSGSFYPVKPWSVNYFDALNNGATRLALMPAQYKSDTLGSLTGTLRQYNAMTFRLYYSDNLNQGAAAAPPAISDVRAVATVDSSNQTQINFQARVTGATGTQEVWVTYTGLSGDWYGKWESLFLTPSATDPTVWQGTLPLGGTPVEAVRFMAQATNGSGLVTLATNDGNLFGITPPTPPALINTRLSLSGLPASVPSKDPFPTLQATLTDANDHPLANKTVIFSLGSQLVAVQTNSNGVASFGSSTTVRQSPGTYTAYAYFKGDTSGSNIYQPSSSPSGTLTVTKQTTSLSLTATATSVVYGNPTSLIATLKDGNGLALSQKSVVFVASGPGGTSYGGAVTTDPSGKAKLDAPLWPVGSYSIQAFFGGGATGTVADDQYAASNSGQANLTITQADSQSQLSTTPAAVKADQPITLTAKVSPVAPGLGVPTGQVTFSEGATTLGTVNLTNSQASLTLSTLSAGSHNIVLQYAGDTNFKASTSPTLTVTVNAPPTVAYPTPAATGITPTKATLNAIVNSNGLNLTALAFKWGKDPTNLSNTLNMTPLPTVNNADTPVSAVLTGLDPNTVYYFQVVATNSLGTTTGGVMSFRTAFNLTSYNIVALGNLSFGGGQLQGTVAAGGNASFTNFNLGSNMPTPSNTLLVGGNLTLGSGQISGNALYGGTLSQSKQTTFKNGRAILTPNPLELTNTTAYAQNVALAWKNLGGTVATSQYSTLNLTASAGQKVFAVSGADLAQVRSLKITAPATATVIINVSGATVNLSSFNVNLQGGIGAANVVFNFYEATTFSITSTNGQGTFWLPNAVATIGQSNLTGGLVVKNLTASSLNVNNVPFAGALPL